MNAFALWLTSPIGIAVWVALAVLGIGLARWVGGPGIWAYFWQGMREGFGFYAAAFTPWTWLRRWRAWRERQP